MKNINPDKGMEWKIEINEYQLLLILQYHIKI